MTMNKGPREWDAEVYDRVSDPQFAWAQEVLERLPLEGDEVVLDAGCGSGRVTEQLVSRLPRGRVIGADASEGMIEKARERLGPQADLRVADLTELELEEPVDAVFSNAVFHWIPDHDRLFARLHGALRPRGRLVAQCGGKGNVASLVHVLIEVVAEDRFVEHFGDFKGIWNFSSDSEAAECLRGAGFEDVRCWLEQKLVTPEEPVAFLRTVTLGPHLARLPEELRQPFAEAVAERMGEPLTLDYMRLNIEARRPSS
jgi:trans-aconitate 2-methyltransferase